MNLLLSIIAVVLFILIEPLNFIFVVIIKRHKASGYFRSLAVGIDRFGNYQFRTLFNAVLRTENGYEFGNFNETISSALGKNELNNTLSTTGKFLVKILNAIDENHCINSINNNV